MTCIHQRFAQGLGVYFQRWVCCLLVYRNGKARLCFDKEIDDSIKSLEYKACNFHRPHRVMFTYFHVHCVLSVVSMNLIFTNDLLCIAVLDSAIAVLICNIGTIASY